MDERVRLREAKRRALPPDRVPQQARGEVRHHIGDRDVEEDRRAPPVERRDDRDQEPDRAVRADAREGDEHVVEDADAMVDDPAL
jgi:hypothetical protein